MVKIREFLRISKPPVTNSRTMTPTYANGRISATGDPIYFMFGSRVGIW